jgi:hypothetical protein
MDEKAFASALTETPLRQLLAHFHAPAEFVGRSMLTSDTKTEAD